MSNIAIKVENLSKRYRIGLEEEVHDTITGALKSFIRSPFKNLRQLRNLSRLDDYDAEDIIWALKDVSFEVNRGEVIGIIGRNGAGKSTLLKILSRITEPTSGRVEIIGRVSSLLEVGTGFHPELTGRENIYLNGTILGMRKVEIDRKFDEIVDFSGIEKFIDTPVKRYSSGMNVRLAFSVVAHLEPEILLIDEVLAVGDAEFQKKCLGKMESVANVGRTVLFVSHNMAAITDLTRRCLMLESGRIQINDKSQNVVNIYLEQSLRLTSENGYADLTDFPRHKIFGGHSRLSWIRIINTDGNQSSTILEQKPIKVQIGFAVVKPTKSIQIGCGVVRVDRSYELFTAPSPVFDIGIEPGDYSTELVISPNYLRDGLYSINLKMLADGQRQETLRGTIIFAIARESTRTDDPYYQRWVNGPLRFQYEWQEIRRENPNNAH